MSIQFLVNVSKSAALRSGFSFWRLKDLLVATGRWSVIGSGDGSSRFAYNGVTSALPAPQRGSGGAYDCLMTGSGVGSPATAGDWGVGGWCVVRDQTGREFLFVDSTGTPDSSWNSYGRVAYSRSIGFVGTSVSATVIPAAASDEQWVQGARGTPNGVQLFSYNVAAYLHFYAHDAPVNGVCGFGWNSASAAGVVGGIFHFSATQEFDANGMADPCAFMYTNSYVTAGWYSAGTVFGGWSSNVSPNNPAGTTLPAEPMGGGKDSVTGVYVYTAPTSNYAGISAADLGYMVDVVADRFTPSRSHPDVINCGSSTWLCIGAGYCMPWPSTAVVPLSGTSVIRSGTLYLPTLSKGRNVVPVNQELIPVSYYQRVWDVVNQQWCYYTKSEPDPTPSTTETNPVNSGTISGHSVLRIKVG